MRHKQFRWLRPLTLIMAALAVAISLASPVAAAPDDGQWDPTLPKLLSSGAPGDPLAIANASLAVTAQATEATMSLGRKFLESMGLVSPSAAGLSPGARVRGPQAIEYAIRRGVDDGANIVGFDCSGLTQFSFAGVGVLIPKYSGDQYDTGRKVPVSQAKRGDLLFWGPGGTQHVAIFLGNGQMLEASGSGGKVQVSPVRTSGLQPPLDASPSGHVDGFRTAWNSCDGHPDVGCRIRATLVTLWRIVDDVTRWVAQLQFGRARGPRGE